jgi:DNA-binding CsgD family transcriptional regulator
MPIAEQPKSEVDVLLKRRRPAFLLLDGSLNIACAEPFAFELLAEAFGDEAPAQGAVPMALIAAIREHTGTGGLRPLTLMLRGLVLHSSVLRGRSEYYVVSIERIAVRDHLKQSMERYALTRREGQVLALVLDGRRARDIADELCISPMTLRDHFTSLLRKTGSRSRSEMLAKLMSS